MRTLMAFVTLLLLFCTCTASAEPVVKEIFYQKTTTLKQKTATLRLSLWDTEVGGKELWSEEKTVALTKKVVNTYLGEINPLDEVDFSKQLWVQVDVKINGTYATEGKRDRFPVVPYALWSAQSSQSGGEACEIVASLPYTVTFPGKYCFKKNLSTGISFGSAITIDADNVVIDLGGFSLEGLEAGPGTLANGIRANQRYNITVRNGSVRGFSFGISLGPLGDAPFISGGHIIEDIRADSNTFYGIHVNGFGNFIRNNQILNTGGSSRTPFATGISVTGPCNRVMNNDVYETKEQVSGESKGIILFNAQGCIVENNRVGNRALGSGTSDGIMIDSSSNVIVINNRLTNMTNGVQYWMGATGKYRDNVTSGVTTPFYGGTDAGGNN